MKPAKKPISLIALSILPLLAIYHLQRPWDTNMVSPAIKGSSPELALPNDAKASSLSVLKVIPGNQGDSFDEQSSANSKQLWRDIVKNASQINPEVGSFSQLENPLFNQGNQNVALSQTRLLPDFFRPEEEKRDRPKISGKLLTNDDDEIVGAKVSVSLPTQH